MKIHRFIGDFDLFRPTPTSKDSELINQIKNVLRLSVGEQVVLFDGNGLEALANIGSIGKDIVSFNILEKKEVTFEATRTVVAYCSILKRENFELIVQKAVECGVKKIVPIISDRTIKTGLKIDRLEKIIKEASEQCGRGIVPKLGEITSLSSALAEAGDNELNLFFDISGEKFAGTGDVEQIGFFIGPEGGWTNDELLLARQSGCKIVGLGPLTLRGETAAIVAAYLTSNF